jgi:transposase-like protein
MAFEVFWFWVEHMKPPKTLQQAIQYFSDYNNCRQFMIAVRWPDGKVRCPYCGSDKVTHLEKARLYRCYGDHPKQKFSLKIGTVMEDSPIPLEKWLPAMWMLCNCRNGVSSYEIHRALGVTQKSAWFMMHRIRLAMQDGSIVKLGGDSGEVEADETFIGGKARNMHRDVRARKVSGQGTKNHHAIVMGIVERGGKIRAQVIQDRNRKTVNTMVKENVKAGSALFTDEHGGYYGLAREYQHQVVDHAVRYVDGKIHTNSMENFWSLLKRGLHGTYVSVEPFHLYRYLDEQVFRYNNRRDENRKPVSDAERFSRALKNVVSKRLTYAELTDAVGQTETF